MKADTLITIQLISLALIIGSAEGFLENTISSITFIVAFIIFAVCSIYIGRNRKDIIKETNRRYSRKKPAVQ